MRFAVCRCLRWLVRSSSKIRSMIPVNGPSFGRLGGALRRYPGGTENDSILRTVLRSTPNTRCSSPRHDTPAEPVRTTPPDTSTPPPRLPVRARRLYAVPFFRRSRIDRPLQWGIIALPFSRELVNAILAELAGKLTNRQINRIGTSAKHNEPVRVVGPSDPFFASHRSTIEVTPNLVVWNGTPMPSIGGQVHLKWWDDYDCNPNRPYFPGVPIPKPIIPMDSLLFAITYRDLDALQACTNGGAAEFKVEAK